MKLDISYKAPSLSVDFGPKQKAAISTGVQIVRSIEGSSLPPGGQDGDVLLKVGNDDYNAAWVAPASSAEQDNTRPITAAAVYTEIGNINALLATI